MITIFMLPQLWEGVLNDLQSVEEPSIGTSVLIAELIDSLVDEARDGRRLPSTVEEFWQLRGKARPADGEEQ